MLHHGGYNMGGIGLMGRRRFIASTPVKGDSSVQEYKRLVVASGAYFITDYYPSNYDRLTFKMQPQAYPRVLFGARKGMGVVMLANTADIGYASWDSDTAKQLAADWRQNIARDLGMFLDGNQYKAVYGIYGTGSYAIIKTYSEPPADKTSQVPLYICASLTVNSDNALDSRYFQGSFYGLQVIDSRSGNVKHDFVPAVNGAEVGIYDRITGAFYGNSGTGEVTADNEEEFIGL